MAGAIIENLSGRKLSILCFILVIGQITCFLLGGLIAPAPSSTFTVLGTVCLDKAYNESKIYLSNGRNRCHSISLSDPDISKRTDINADNIIFVFQVPQIRNNVQLDYSRWQQNLIAMMMISFSDEDNQKYDPSPALTIDAKLSYKNKWNKENDWKIFAHSVEERRLDCFDAESGGMSLCAPIPVFEIGSLYHDFYVLNLRFPNTLKSSKKKLNEHLIRFEDINMAFINQNGGFTKVWLSLKTVFFPLIIAIMAWFWHRISLLSRPAALLEYMLMCLGGALTVLNLPVEFLTLYFDCPWIVLFADLRQGIFYAVLLSFWLIFAGEHLMDDIERNRLRSYWRHLSAVMTGCLCLFIFDVCERGVQLTNPFASIWSTETGITFALTFILIAGICAGVYFCFLCYMIYKVFRNISSKKNSLHAMASSRRMKYQGIIYRFKVLMLATLLCAAVTVIAFIMGQVSEGQRLDEDPTEVEYTSAFLTGVYGMWNIYTIAVICLYAPSHKIWPKDTGLASIHGVLMARDGQSSTGEEIEFSRLMGEPSELSSLTGLAKKANVD